MTVEVGRDQGKIDAAEKENEGKRFSGRESDHAFQAEMTTEDAPAAAGLVDRASSISSVRAHYPSEEVTQEDGDRVGVDGTQTEGEGAEQMQEKEEGDAQHKQVGKRDKGVPTCLMTFRDNVEACSHRVQAWSDEQELKARQRQARKRDQSDGGVRVEEDGRVIEPKGDNLAQRKGIVVLVFVILTWVYIAFVWRICANAIQQKPTATATRQEGIGLLVGFNILWLWSMWSYVKVVVTEPGFVRDHVDISEPPKELEYERTHLYPQIVNTAPATEAEGNASTPMHAPTPFSNQNHVGMQNSPADHELPAPPSIRAEMPASNSVNSVDSKLAAALGPIGVSMVARLNEASNVRQNPSTKDDSQPSGQVVEQNTSQQPAMLPQYQVQQPADGFPAPMRLPMTDFPLHPSNTYCYRCKRVKPPRAHHCRHCGTCVLKMDHHCPWVGGCVGARNHKFFWNFLQSVTLLELFVLITNAVMFDRGIRRLGTPLGWTIDGYMISLFPLSALFFMFTLALLITHTYMFVMNLTTIEHMGYERQKTRENILIERWLEEKAKREGREKPGFLQQTKERNAVKKGWSLFWGSPKSEANLWWLDGRRAARLMDKEGEVQGDEKHVPIMLADEREEDVMRPIAWWQAVGTNWREAMGDSAFGWFFPVGRARNAHGMTFEANWRFGRWGEWTTRQQWPLRLAKPGSSANAGQALSA